MELGDLSYEINDPSKWKTNL